MKSKIDIDDTLTDTYELTFNYVQDFTANELKKEINHVDREKIKDRFTKNFHNWSKEEEIAFFDRYYETIVRNVRIKPFAKEIIDKLRDEKNEIYFITARFLSSKFDIEQATKKWLEENEIKYEGIYLNISNKAEIIKENNIDIFIDDNINNCLNAVENEIKTYIMDSLVNYSFKDERIERIYSWPHLYQAINRYKEEIGGNK